MVQKTKQKPLQPTLKEKKRYLTYKVHGTSLPNNAGNQLISELQKYLGVSGTAKAGLLPIIYDAEKQTGVFRVSNASLSETRAALLLLHKIQQQEVMIQPLIISGILKKAKQAM